MALPFLDNLNSILSGVAPMNYGGGLINPMDAQAAQRQGQLGLGAGLLGAAGPNPRPVSFGQALSGAMLQSNAMQNNSIDDAMKRQLLASEAYKNLAAAQLAGSRPGHQFTGVNPSDFTPQSLAKFQQTQNFADLEPINKLFNRFNPRDYTPESLAMFEKSRDPNDLRRVAPLQFKDTPGGGITALDPISGAVAAQPLTPEAGTQQAAAKTKAMTEAELTAKATGAMFAKAQNSKNIDSLLGIADPLIDEATGSGTGATRDKLAAYFGVSTSGARAIAQLKPLQAAIMMNQPRMEGPQSDKDVQLYREAAGQIGDPEVPAETKKAALKTIRTLQQKYREIGSDMSNPSGVENDPLGIRSR